VLRTPGCPDTESTDICADVDYPVSGQDIVKMVLGYIRDLSAGRRAFQEPDPIPRDMHFRLLVIRRHAIGQSAPFLPTGYRCSSYFHPLYPAHGQGEIDPGERFPGRPEKYGEFPDLPD